MFPKNKQTWANKSTVYTVNSATYQNIILYVATTGNDLNNGLSASLALRTPQEAINRIPKYLKHDVTISIGTGSFNSFHLDGFVQESGYFKIAGTLGDPTLVSGTVSGIATAGSTTTLTDAGQNWVVDALRGFLVLVAGEYRVVLSNTAKIITFAGEYAATTNGKAYHIYEQKTIISGQTTYTKASDGTAFNTSILIRNCKVLDTYIENIKISTTTNASASIYLVDSCGFIGRQTYINGFTNANPGQFGIYVENCNDCEFDDIYSTNTYYSVNVFTSTDVNLIGILSYSNNIGFMFGQSSLDMCERLYAFYNVEGFYFYGKNSYFNTDYLNASLNSNNGINLNANLTLSNAVVSYNSNYGIVVGSTQNNYYGTLEIISTSVISNNTVDGIIGNDHSLLNVRYATGTTNGGYGVRCKNSNILIHSSGNTTITGTSGTYTLDDGVNSAINWTTNFVANGDSVYELTTSTLGVRRD